MLEEVIGSKTKIHVLQFLVGDPQRESTLQDLSAALRTSTGSLHPALRQLVGTRIVLSRRFGRSRAYRVNERHVLYTALRDLFRREGTALQALAQAFAEALPREGISAVVLFGSVSSGRPSPGSDVDVLVVVERRSVAGRVRRIAEGYLEEADVSISPLILTREEVSGRLRAFDPLLLTIAREGKLLRGRAEWLGR